MTSWYLEVTTERSLLTGWAWCGCCSLLDFRGTGLRLPWHSTVLNIPETI